MYFSVSYCPHCKNFDPVWNAAMALLDTYRVPINARKFVCDTDRQLAARYGVKQFPTILFDGGKGRIFSFQGNRTADNILNWVNACRAMP